MPNSAVSLRFQRVPPATSCALWSTTAISAATARMGRYRLGMKVLSLSRAALSGVDVREVALPIMRHLVDRIHITTHLAILDHDEAVYVEKVEAPGFIKMNTWIGRRMEVHSTAVGKALLAYLDPEGARRDTSPARAEEADARTPSRPCRGCCRNSSACGSWAMPSTTRRTAWARAAWGRRSSTAGQGGGGDRFDGNDQRCAA